MANGTMSARLKMVLFSLHFSVGIFLAPRPAKAATIVNGIPLKAAVRVAPKSSKAFMAQLCEDLKANSDSKMSEVERVQKLRGAGELQACKSTAVTPMQPGSVSTCLSIVTNLCPPAARELEAAVPTTNASPVASGVSWQTAFVQGLAQYLQQRAGQEMTLWLEQDFFDSLCVEELPPIGGHSKLTGAALFPQTCRLTQDDPTHMGSTFAAALRADLEAMPATLGGYQLKVDPRILSTLMGVLIGIREGKPPLELIAGLSQNQDLLSLCPDSGAGVDQNTYDAACGLIGIGFVVSWAQDMETTQSAATTIDSIAQQIVKLAAANPKLKLKSGLTTDDVKPFLTDIQSIFVLVQNWQSLPTTTPAEQAARGGMLLGRIIDAVEDGTKMLGSSTFFFPPDTSDWGKLEKVLRATSTLLQGDVADGVQLGIEAVLAIDPNLPKSVVQLLTMSADLAGAKSPDEINSALQNDLAPLGSWRGKHQSSMISLSAFAGFAGGWEEPLVKLANSSNAGGLKGNLAFGAFAPVGIDFTVPSCLGATGAFVSVLDVGQLLTSPINPGSGGGATSKTAQPGGSIEIVQVLSPGMYLHTSIGNSPITFGVGAALAPLLRTYQLDGSSNKSEYSMLRYNAFLAVDLNLLPIARGHASAQ